MINPEVGLEGSRAERKEAEKEGMPDRKKQEFGDLRRGSIFSPLECYEFRRFIHIW